MRVRSYALSVTHDEWTSMAHGEPSPQTFAALNGIWQTYSTIDLQTERRRVLLAVGRADRGLGHDDRIYILHGCQEPAGAAMMTAWLGGTLGLLLFVILLLNVPFTGDLRISPAAFHQSTTYSVSLGRRERCGLGSIGRPRGGTADLEARPVVP